MTLNKIITPVNLVYAILLIIAIILAINDYGLSSIIQTIAVFYCIIQLVINFSTVYLILKAKIRKRIYLMNMQKTLILVVSFLTIGVLFFLVLTDYFKRFVLSYSTIILAFLFIYDIGKTLIKRSA